MAKPKEDPAALGHASFWDQRYASASKSEENDDSKPTHEWFRTFDSLLPFFEKHLFNVRSKDDLILHLGSGDSTIPTDLYARGYMKQVCIDFSEVVISLMRSRHNDKPGIEWRVADVREMSMAAESVDVAFDKGTLDAMIYGSPWSPPDEVIQNTGKYINEVRRILKPTGIFLYITYRQPHFVKPILNRATEWDLEMDVLGGGDSSFEYFGFALRKHGT